MGHIMGSDGTLANIRDLTDDEASKIAATIFEDYAVVQDAYLRSMRE